MSSKEDFDAIDTDGDGVITASELLTALGSNPKVTPQDVATIIQMADQDGDLKVTYEEYEKFAL
jgi:Ca2+-binding EF-hand superfamily protein